MCNMISRDSYLYLSDPIYVEKMMCYVIFSYRCDTMKFKLNVKESIDACLDDIMNYDPSDSHSVKYDSVINQWIGVTDSSH